MYVFSINILNDVLNRNQSVQYQCACHQYANINVKEISS